LSDLNRRPTVYKTPARPSLQQNPKPGGMPLANVTVKTALQNWLTLASAGKRPATARYYSEIVKIFAGHFPNVDTTDPGAVAPDQFAGFIGAVAHYSAPRFNQIISTLKFICPGCPPMRRRPPQPHAGTVPTQAEFSRLLAELDNAHRGSAGQVARLLALTGLRIKEARALQWSDVQPDGILVPGSVTKNGRPRRVPLVAGLPEVLARLKETPPDRQKILPQASLKTALTNAAARAGLPRMNHHDCRRLFATRCIESGVDIPTAARWLGHQDGGALLAKTYFHLLDGHSKTMAAKVAVF